VNLTQGKCLSIKLRERGENGEKISLEKKLTCREKRIQQGARPANPESLINNGLYPVR
jgi:hypothetical protein